MDRPSIYGGADPNVKDDRDGIIRSHGRTAPLLRPLAVCDDLTHSERSPTLHIKTSRHHPCVWLTCGDGRPGPCAPCIMVVEAVLLCPY